MNELHIMIQGYETHNLRLDIIEYFKSNGCFVNTTTK